MYTKISATMITESELNTLIMYSRFPQPDTYTELLSTARKVIANRAIRSDYFMLFDTVCMKTQQDEPMTIVAIDDDGEVICAYMIEDKVHETFYNVNQLMHYKIKSCSV